MKKFIILFFMGFSFFTFAQKEMDGKWLEVPGNLKEHASAIVREYKVGYILKSPSDLEENVYMVLTILDNEGKKFATQVWHYDLFSKYTSGEIQIFDKNGQRLEKESLRDMDDYASSGISSFYDDSRYKVYEPLVKETPYTIVIQYTKKITDFFQLPTWHPQSNSKIAVENASLTIFNQGNIDFKINQQNFQEGSFTFTDEDQKKQWEFKNIKAFKPETYRKQSSLARLILPMKNFQVEGYSGSNDSWETLGNWSLKLLEGRDKLPEETKVKIQAMVNGIEDPKEKAKVIYAWMQENTRYISIQEGIGGWQPFPASEVDELKYGDCKGLVNYTKALFAVAGIESYYSRIYAGNGSKNLLRDFPSNQFNHIILCIPFNGDTTWAECTADNIALGYLGDFTDDRYALLVDRDQSKLVKTIAYPKEKNLQIREANIQVNIDGSIKATINTAFSGVQFENRRAQINENEKDRKEFLYNTLSISGFTIKNMAYDYKKEILPEIKEVLEIEAVKFASVTGSRMFIPLNLMNKSENKPEKDTVRINPIFVNMAYIDIDSLVYQIPEGYEVERLPEDKNLESKYGNYSSKAVVEGNRIIYVRKQEQDSGEFPAEGWHDFRQYKLDIVKADKATAILRKIVN